jgi:nitrogen fixation/metabolism regulation signal transduction histidine kinase
MNYKNFYPKIALRLIVTVALAAASTYFFVATQNNLLGTLLFLCMVYAMADTIRFFNIMNRWLAFFLLGIENEDTTLRIPPKSGNKSIDAVYDGVDRLNTLFRQKKADLSIQEQYFRSIINQSATGLFSVNGFGRIANINPAAAKLTGLYEQQHVNSLQNIDLSLPGFLNPEKCSAGEKSAIFENRQGLKLLFRVTEMETPKEKIRLVAVSDITKELDTREVDAWVKLARTLTHEIMNNIVPITTLSQVITGYFSKEGVAIEPGQVDEKMLANTTKGLKVIEERSLGLMNFVENYRKFTKLPVPNITKVDISALMDSCLLSAQAFPGFENIKTIKTLNGETFFPTDEKLLSQVILNILKNGCEALVESRTVKPEIHITLNISHYRCQIEIFNNGPQIPAEIREQIFVPFFTTKEEGTGIGLSLSRQILLQMGGDISFKSERDGDTRFTIILQG